MEIKEERITRNEYIDFLKRTDLGSQYPMEDFNDRIQTLVEKVSISLIARDEGKIVGVIFGLTDFSYWLFVTDLGVDRNYARKGIGRNLMEKALEVAGGKDKINVYLCANDEAIPFYQKLGMEKSNDIFEYAHAKWTDFVVK